jgi:hypothetical protein
VIASGQHWEGLVFGPHAAGSAVHGLEVAYGGANGRGNVVVDGCDPTFSALKSQHSDAAGLYVTGDAAPEIRDSEFVNNDDEGIYVAPGAGLARSPLGPTFLRNVLTGNGLAPVVLPAREVAQLDRSSSFAGNGLPIGIHGGTVAEDAVWRKLDEDYQVRGVVDIGGPDGPVVELEDLVVLLFDRRAGLTAGAIDDGALRIEAPIGVVMDGSAAAPAAGDWAGLVLGRNAAERPQSSLRGLAVWHAGATGASPTDPPGAAIALVERGGCAADESGGEPGAEPGGPPGSAVELTNVEIHSSGAVGLRAAPGTTLRAEEVWIDRALAGCVRVEVDPPTDEGPGCTATIMTFTDNACTESPVFGSWPLDALHALDPASNALGGPVVIDDALLAHDATMPLLPVPYRFTQRLRVQGPDGDLGPVLVVAGGNELQFTDDAGIEVGIEGRGGLVVEPDTTLTSAHALPAPGDWAGLRLGSLCTAVDLDGVALAFGGANDKGGLWLDGCTPTAGGLVDDLTLTDSSSCGLFDGGGALADLLGAIRYANNAGGDVCL